MDRGSEERAGSGGARSFTALAGLTAGLVFATGSAIWGLEMPNAGAPAAEILDFYGDTSDRIVVGASLSLVAIAAFILFAAGLRQVLAEAGGEDYLATAALGGALMAAATGIGAETINMAAALRAGDGDLDPELARALFETSQILGSTATGVGLGVFAVATAAVTLRTRRVLPRWLALATLIGGLVALTPIAHVNELAGAFLVFVTVSVAVTLLRPRALPGGSGTTRPG